MDIGPIVIPVVSKFKTVAWFSSLNNINFRGVTNNVTIRVKTVY